MNKEVNICEKRLTIILSLTLLFGFYRPRVESLLNLAPSASFKKQMHGLHPLAESAISSHHRIIRIYANHICANIFIHT